MFRDAGELLTVVFLTHNMLMRMERFKICMYTTTTWDWTFMVMKTKHKDHSIIRNVWERGFENEYCQGKTQKEFQNMVNLTLFCTNFINRIMSTFILWKIVSYFCLHSTVRRVLRECQRIHWGTLGHSVILLQQDNKDLHNLQPLDGRFRLIK